MTDDIPVALRDFITQSIESLAQLETLLLLHRNPGRELSSQDVAAALYISSDMSLGILKDLEMRALASRGASAEHFLCVQGNPSLEAIVAQLEQVYRVRPVAVITQIYSKPVNKVQTFADAFRLRREE